ncbi:TPA: hypothetical protein K8N36_002994 [Clostridium perfringens]|uniref:DUF6809 family protein n=1 Tax=Clostridium perfringens TaxID=1502 RepID=UPI001CAD1624|nr:hypothetical protein [Clostridium perfringens]HBI6884209.1 hypothetical protein [Clostridium perfringens]HBI6902027.1 hypothetical protein [Clostridium perfringens]HBI6931006.1 hypothetical protein [Clostridium perfringens]HBI6941167.1 hypothetical protein [Clostridium perfringens]
MINLSLAKEDRLINNVIELEKSTYPAQGYEFWEKEETKQTIKEYREELEKSEKILMSLLDDKGRKELRKFIDISDDLNSMEKDNSFNNGVRSGLTNLAFLKDYFSTF